MAIKERADDRLVIKRARGEDGYKTFSIRVPVNVFDKVDDISNQTGRSRNEVISIMLEYAVDRCEIE